MLPERHYGFLRSMAKPVKEETVEDFDIGAPAKGREGEVNIARYHSGSEGLAVTVTVTGNPERLKDYDTVGKPIAQRIVKQLLGQRG